MIRRRSPSRNSQSGARSQESGHASKQVNGRRAASEWLVVLGLLTTMLVSCDPPVASPTPVVQSIAVSAVSTLAGPLTSTRPASPTSSLPPSTPQHGSGVATTAARDNPGDSAPPTTPAAGTHSSVAVSQQPGRTAPAGT